MATQRPRPADSPDSISLEGVVLQFGLMCAVFYLWSSPVLQPLKVLVVLFHEMSHGLAAILTGGKVLKIWITPGEGGSCETEGGLPLLIVSAGYLGSMVFGGVILYLSRFRSFVPLVCGMLTLMAISAVVTVLGDTYSRAFASAMAAAFIVTGFIAPAVVGGLALRAIGTVACLYTIFDIYWDVIADSGSREVLNDAIVFSRLSGGISPQSIGMAWMAASVTFFFIVLRSALRPVPAEVGD